MGKLFLRCLMVVIVGWMLFLTACGSLACALCGDSSNVRRLDGQIVCRDLGACAARMATGVFEAFGVPDMADLFEMPGTEPEMAPEESEIVFPSLNLPISTRSTTFAERGVGLMYIISADGTLYEYDDIHMYPWFPITRTQVDTNVRTVTTVPNRQTVFYIKYDNTLWGRGSNQDGRLGDGTGVDRDEPVQILENVASVFAPSYSQLIFALQTDKTLLMWGSGNFSPIAIADDVVEILGHGWCHGWSVMFQKSTGFIYSLEVGGTPARAEALSPGRAEALLRILPVPVVSVCLAAVRAISVRGETVTDFVNSEHTLIRRNYREVGHLTVGLTTLAFDYDEELARDVIFFNTERDDRGRGLNTFIIKTDGSLWAMGVNANGELGDGTRVPRPEPVMIAEDVVYARSFGFLKQDGTYWTWDSSNPIPQQTHENVAAIVENVIIFNDGTARQLASHGLSYFEFSNVKIPQTFVFRNGVASGY